MENINLIRAIAWSFHRTTGINYQELFSEASVGYYEAIQAFSPDKQCKLTSFAQNIMKRRLINFCKNEIKHTITDFPEQYEPHYTPSISFEEKMEEWPPDCQYLIKEIMKNPVWFIGKTPNFKRKLKKPPKTPKGRVKKYLRDKGWEESRIKNTMQKVTTLI